MQTLFELLEQLEDDDSDTSNVSELSRRGAQYVFDALFGLDEEA